MSSGHSMDRRRRDPRSERQRVPLANGRVRVVAGDATVVMAATPAPVMTAETKRQRVVEQPAFLILVVPDAIDGRLSAGDRDLIGAAHALANAPGSAAGAVCGVFFDAPLDDVGAAGCDRVIDLSAAIGAGHAPDIRAAALQQLMQQLQPRHLLLADSDWGGGDLGRRVAALGGEGIATAVSRVDPNAIVRRAGGVETTMRPPRILLLQADVGDAIDDIACEGRTLAVDVTPGTSSLSDRGLRPFDPQSVALEEAEFIVSAGNGISDWATFHALAAALGASEGGSRVVVDAGALPRSRQVGATGAITTARCYVALGISGAPQHLQGIAACEHVIAINRDAACDMMKRANLAIVGDAQSIMKAILEACRDGGH